MAHRNAALQGPIQKLRMTYGTRRAAHFLAALLISAAMAGPGWAADTYRVYATTLSINGDASGTVTLNPAGPSYAPGTSVTATVNPASNSEFVRWEASASNCQGSTSPSCTFTVDFDGMGIRAYLQEKATTTHTLSLSWASSAANAYTAGQPGGGYLVLDTSGGIDFTNGSTKLTDQPGNVVVSFPAGRSVPLKAVYNSLTTQFVGWSGACSGTAPTCNVTMSSNVQVSASFRALDNYTLTIKTSGLGSGTVTAFPARDSYSPGQVVVLTATPSAGSKVFQWLSNGGQFGANDPNYPICTTIPAPATCQVTMDLNRTVTVNFSSDEPTNTKPSGPSVQMSLVFSTAQTKSQSYLRFFNADKEQSGTATVTYVDTTTGKAVNEWTSPIIRPMASLQFPIYEGAFQSSSNKPQRYTAIITSKLPTAHVQNVLWRPEDEALSNLTTCNTGTISIADTLINVHSSSIDYSYPSTIVVNNTAAKAEAVSLEVYSAETGLLLRTYTTAVVPSGGQITVRMADIERETNLTPGSQGPHYVVVAKKPFTGFLQHLVENVASKVLVDMTSVCSIPQTTSTVAN